MLNGTINLITAWASVVLLFLVTIIWVLRLLIKYKYIKKDAWLFGANRELRKHHKTLGILLIITSIIHGLTSSADLFGTNLGSITFYLIAILGISYIVRTKSNRKIWLNIHRVLTVAAVVTLILHLSDVGIQGTNLITSVPPSADEYRLEQDEIDEIVEDIEETETAEQATSTPDTSGSIKYADGAYTGSADGFGLDLTVEVTVADSLITNIVIVSHNERNESYYGLPMELIPQQIIDTQSFDVDTVSGATYTSVGIRNAVIDALSTAVTDGELPEAEQVQSSGKHRNGR